MIYYLFLLIVIASGAVKGYCGKKTSGYASTVRNAAYMNCVRFIFCTLIGLVTAIVTDGGFPTLSPLGFLVSATAGLMQTVFVITWIISVRRSAYTMTDVFLTLGVLIPSVLSELIYDEHIRLAQWIGFAILFVAVYIMCSYNNDIKSRITPVSFLVLFVCGASSGLCDFTQKVFIHELPQQSISAYSFYSYVFATLFLALVMIFIKPKNGEKLCSIKSFIGYVIVMALMMFLNTFFKTKAGVGLSSVQIYPVVQGSALILSALMSAVFFKERITKKSVVGMSLAFAALLIINLL
ncbi:MAG: EamA family transporter [Clostridia bacterium]|nr:EamA family transporter [Clostridia bacterium]